MLFEFANKQADAIKHTRLQIINEEAKSRLVENRQGQIKGGRRLCCLKLGTSSGGASSHPAPATPFCPGREAGCGNAETRRGGISLEDLPEKCHAGSDEERNLDGEREKRRSQPIETQPGSCNGEGKPVPLSHPFEIQVQGHEPREEWQRGPAPEQTGSHRTGPQSSSPRLAPSHLSPPRLAQAYGSQAADPQWTGWSPALLSPHLRASAGPETAAASTRGKGPCRERDGERWRERRGGGYLRCLTAPPAPRPLDGGPAESAADDNPHLTTRPFCLQGLRRSTHPHGNSGRAVHTIFFHYMPHSLFSPNLYLLIPGPALQGGS
ncbi:hypothetical protein INR49_030821 [Caranx melampygus]|nr:hypothetical protein INR49_030821 [Caranx melampygus]